MLGKASRSVGWCSAAAQCQSSSSAHRECGSGQRLVIASSTRSVQECTKKKAPPGEGLSSIEFCPDRYCRTRKQRMRNAAPRRDPIFAWGRRSDLVQAMTACGRQRHHFRCTARCELHGIPTVGSIVGAIDSPNSLLCSVCAFLQGLESSCTSRGRGRPLRSVTGSRKPCALSPSHRRPPPWKSTP